MRLIDADALQERAVYANLSTKTVDALHDLLDAAPTIPTTETNNGVTSCRFCGGVVDVEYQEATDATD